jgi:hypothetical protein
MVGSPYSQPEDTLLQAASHEILKQFGGCMPKPCGTIAQPEAIKQSRANPRADAAMKLLLPGAPNPEQVTPRGALRSMQRYRLHLGF